MFVDKQHRTELLSWQAFLSSAGLNDTADIALPKPTLKESITYTILAAKIPLSELASSLKLENEKKVSELICAAHNNPDVAVQLGRAVFNVIENRKAPIVRFNTRKHKKEELWLEATVPESFPSQAMHSHQSLVRQWGNLFTIGEIEGMQEGFYVPTIEQMARLTHKAGFSVEEKSDFYRAAHAQAELNESLGRPWVKMRLEGPEYYPQDALTDNAVDKPADEQRETFSAGPLALWFRKNKESLLARLVDISLSSTRNFEIIDAKPPTREDAVQAPVPENLPATHDDQENGVTPVLHAQESAPPHILEDAAPDEELVLTDDQKRKLKFGPFARWVRSLEPTPEKLAVRWGYSVKQANGMMEGIDVPVASDIEIIFQKEKIHTPKSKREIRTYRDKQRIIMDQIIEPSKSMGR